MKKHPVSVELAGQLKILNVSCWKWSLDIAAVVWQGLENLINGANTFSENLCFSETDNVSKYFNGPSMEIKSFQELLKTYY